MARQILPGEATPPCTHMRRDVNTATPGLAHSPTHPFPSAISRQVSSKASSFRTSRTTYGTRASLQTRHLPPLGSAPALPSARSLDSQSSNVRQSESPRAIVSKEQRGQLGSAAL